MRVGLGLLAMVLCAGCLHSEEMEFRILRDGGEPAVLVCEQINCYSSNKDEKGIRTDFDQLIRDWRGENVSMEGAVIKGRELFIRDGKIVSRLTAILQKLDVDNDIRIGDSQIAWTMDDDYEIVE